MRRCSSERVGRLLSAKSKILINVAEICTEDVVSVDLYIFTKLQDHVSEVYLRGKVAVAAMKSYIVLAFQLRPNSLLDVKRRRVCWLKECVESIQFLTDMYTTMSAVIIQDKIRTLLCIWIFDSTS